MTDLDLDPLLAAAAREAFHGRPADAVAAARTALAASASGDRAASARADQALARWLYGVGLGAGGRYGQALDVLEPLVREAEDGAAGTRGAAALAGATVASVHRQLARHAVARTWDERALALTDEPGVAFDAVLGLAADAVGLAEHDVARARLAEAAALVEQTLADGWRPRVRLEWVRAEVALLLDGDPAAAVVAAGRAVGGAEQAGAPRHLAKSLLFSGVAVVETGSMAAGLAPLRRAAALAQHLGALPLVWPTCGVLARLLADSRPDEAAAAHRAGQAAIKVISADLPDDVGDPWRARPDVAALLLPTPPAPAPGPLR